MLDFIFPPSLQRITRSFERTRQRLIRFSLDRRVKAEALSERALDLNTIATSFLTEAQRATSIALKLDNLLN